MSAIHYLCTIMNAPVEGSTKSMKQLLKHFKDPTIQQGPDTPEGETTTRQLTQISESFNQPDELYSMFERAH